MSLTKRIPEVLGLVAALVLAGGCETLNIKNPNAPDTSRALGDPATVQAIAAGALRTWFNVTQNMEPVGILIVGADSHTAPWNNFQIRFYTGCTDAATPTHGTCGVSETDPTQVAPNAFPRNAWQNDPTAAERLQIEIYWYGYYSALSSASDVVRAIRKNGILITDDKNTKMVETVAVLVQGLALSGLALNYDRGFVLDENTALDPNGLPILPATYSSRTVLRDAALAKFNDVINILTTFPGGFTMPATFVGSPNATVGNPFNAPAYTAVRLRQIANTMAARTLAYFPRNSTENDAVNWAQVLTYASNGISSGAPFDWVFQHDGCVNWCDYLKAWSNDMRTMRIHTRVAHLMDPTTQPDPFNAAGTSQPVWQTTSFDKRLGDGTYLYPNAAAGNRTITKVPQTANHGTDYAFSTTLKRFPAARGLWRQSGIGQIRYITSSEIDPNGSGFGFGPGPIVLAAENDLLWAEALIRGTPQDLATAATKINNTRVGRGGATAAPFAPAAASDGVAGLLQELQYEQDVELPGSNAVPFYNQRRITPPGQGSGRPATPGLEQYTPHEMPVPAKELGVLGVPLYTWGGNCASCVPSSSPTAPGLTISTQNAQRIWAELEHQMRMRVMMAQSFTQ